MPARILSWLGSLWCYAKWGTGGTGAADKYLTLTQTGSQLGRTAVRGGAITIISQALGLCLQIGSTITLARLLMPRDFGLVTMVTTFSLLLQSVGANGFTEAIVQREVITHKLLSTLFWINVGVGLLLTLGFAFASTYVAWLYGEPELRAICAAVAVSILMDHIGTLHVALLRRGMQFGVINSAVLGARASGLGVAIAGAANGWGYWALVANLLVYPFVISVIAWLCCSWRPGLPARDADTRPVIKFALHTYGYFCANYVCRNLDNLLVGWCYGSLTLGNYKRAYDLFALPLSQLTAPLTAVALPTLSRLRSDAVRFRKYYLKSISLIAFTGMGLSAIFTLTGKDLLVLLLGQKWIESGRIFTYFGPGIGIMLILSTNRWLFLPLGRADQLFRWGVCEVLVTGLLFVIGLPFGPRGVALAWACSFFLLAGPGLSYAGRLIGLRFSAIFSVAFRYAFSALVAGVLCWCLLNRVDSGVGRLAAESIFVKTVVHNCLFGVLYLCGLLLFPFSSTFGPMIDTIRALKSR